MGKKPKKVIHPVAKPIPQVRIAEDPGNFDRQTPAWRFDRCDQDHEHWGWGAQEAQTLQFVLHEMLPRFEGMTWAQIKQQSGGRNHGTNSHSLSVDGFCARARKRLSEMRLEEVDTLFSLRHTSGLRVYGIREGRLLHLIWCDPHHKDNEKAAYPTGG